MILWLPYLYNGISYTVNMLSEYNESEAHLNIKMSSYQYKN